MPPCHRHSMPYVMPHVMLLMLFTGSKKQSILMRSRGASLSEMRRSLPERQQQCPCLERLPLRRRQPLSITCCCPFSAQQKVCSMHIISTVACSMLENVACCCCSELFHPAAAAAALFHHHQVIRSGMGLRLSLVWSGLARPGFHRPGIRSGLILV